MSGAHWPMGLFPTLPVIVNPSRRCNDAGERYDGDVGR
jgi:hypothetical protein